MLAANHQHEESLIINKRTFPVALGAIVADIAVQPAAAGEGNWPTPLAHVAALDPAAAV
ncbi:hypothetical protein [Rathayibacter toxicus]|uniref:hypothetical protein n=1 Tax=Rathayibacter toxicus TaxID=145458 RepID=UPI0015E35684|nr:hypothetical protein [Rathayibacter toxicus]QOD11307.1 hypothetical protein BSG36_05050 [Rathayibacter toxicus]